MAVVQSSYSERIARGYAGMVINTRDQQADTRIAEAAIGFGVAVGQGTAEKGATLGASAANKFVGVSIRDITIVPLSGGAADSFADGENVGVLTEGDILVAVGAPVTAGQDVTFATSTGVLSSTAAGGSQFTIAGARWMTTQATVGGLAVLRLSGSLPGA